MNVRSNIKNIIFKVGGGIGGRVEIFRNCAIIILYIYFGMKKL